MIVAMCWIDAPWLIVAGAVLELAGIAGIALGVMARRRRFSDRAGVWNTVIDKVSDIERAAAVHAQKVMRRLLGRKDATVTPATVATKVTIPESLVLTDQVSYHLWSEEESRQIELLREWVRDLGKGQDAIRAELANNRQEQSDALAAVAAIQAKATEEALEEMRDLASGTLRLEAWSALALALGVVLTMFGSLCSIG